LIGDTISPSPFRIAVHPFLSVRLDKLYLPGSLSLRSPIFSSKRSTPFSPSTLHGMPPFSCLQVLVFTWRFVCVPFFFPLTCMAGCISSLGGPPTGLLPVSFLRTFPSVLCKLAFFLGGFPGILPSWPFYVLKCFPSLPCNPLVPWRLSKWFFLYNTQASSRPLTCDLAHNASFCSTSGSSWVTRRVSVRPGFSR